MKGQLTGRAANPCGSQGSGDPKQGCNNIMAKDNRPDSSCQLSAQLYSWRYTGW